MIGENGKKPDPDLSEFNRRLASTHRGKVYLQACSDQIHAQARIHHFVSTGELPQIERWRRLYIRASDNCSRVLSALEQMDHWPA